MIRGIGINCHDDEIDGHLDRLERALHLAQQAGYDVYELSCEATNAIRNGALVQDEMDRVRDITSRYNLHYTVHPPCELRLTDPTGLGRQLFIGCLEFTAQIGADVMVYHSAQIALRSADQDSGPLPDAAGLQKLVDDETTMLRDMAVEARKRGVIIAIENRDPHLWEVAALARHGKGVSDLLAYHAGLRLDLLVEQVKQVASPNLGICLDTGHAFLAAPYWTNMDFLSGVRLAAPWICHVHFHDNFGRLDDWADSLRERLLFGEADSHIPPGWGKIPLTDVLSILNQAGYNGWLVCELRSRYSEYLPEVASTLRAMIGKNTRWDVNLMRRITNPPRRSAT